MASNSKQAAWDLSGCNANGVDFNQDSKVATFRFINKGHPNTVS